MRLDKTRRRRQRSARARRVPTPTRLVLPIDELEPEPGSAIDAPFTLMVLTFRLDATEPAKLLRGDVKLTS